MHFIILKYVYGIPTPSLGVMVNVLVTTVTHLKSSPGQIKLITLESATSPQSKQGKGVGEKTARLGIRIIYQSGARIVVSLK